MTNTETGTGTMDRATLLAFAAKLAAILTATTARDWTWKNVAPDTYAVLERRSWILIDKFASGLESHRSAFMMLDTSTGMVYGTSAYGRANRRRCYGHISDLVAAKWTAAGFTNPVVDCR